MTYLIQISWIFEHQEVIKNFSLRKSTDIQIIVFFQFCNNVLGVFNNFLPHYSSHNNSEFFFLLKQINHFSSEIITLNSRVLSCLFVRLPVEKKIREGRWRRIRHTLQKSPNCITTQSLNWNPERERKRERWKNTLHWELEAARKNWKRLPRTNFDR